MLNTKATALILKLVKYLMEYPNETATIELLLCDTLDQHEKEA